MGEEVHLTVLVVWQGRGSWLAGTVRPSSLLLACFWQRGCLGTCHISQYPTAGSLCPCTGWQLKTPRLRSQVVNSKKHSCPVKGITGRSQGGGLRRGQVGTKEAACRKEPGAACRSVLAQVLRRDGCMGPWAAQPAALLWGPALLCKARSPPLPGVEARGCLPSPTSARSGGTWVLTLTGHVSQRPSTYFQGGLWSLGGCAAWVARR